MLVWAFRYFAVVVLVAGAFAILRLDLEPDAGRGDVGRAAAGRAAADLGVSASPMALALETVLAPDSRGHYWVRALVDGEPLTFIVDTGASDVILAPDDARRIGLRLETLRFERRYRTANGEIKGALVRLRELRIGQQSLYDLDAVVVDAPLEVSLLGMDFLRRLHGYEVRDGHLVLRW